MKAPSKPILLAVTLLGLLSAHAQAQMYLVSVDRSNTDPYSGNASTDFSISGTVFDVGSTSANDLGNATNQTTPVVFNLGTTATLTLNSGYNSYQNDPSHTDTTSPFHLTKSFVYATSSVTDTFTLSGIAAGSTVKVSAIGSNQTNFVGTLSVSDGVAAAQSAQLASANSSGQGVFTPVATFTNDAATSYNLTFSTTGTEGDLTGLLITVVPEPSSPAVLFGAGALAFCLVKFFGLLKAYRRL